MAATRRLDGVFEQKQLKISDLGSGGLNDGGKNLKR